MKFSSSARRILCGFLAVLCLFEWTGAAALCRADGGEAVLLLKYSNRSISDDTARSRFSVIASEIERRLDVRISPVSRTPNVGDPVLPEADDATLKAIASRVSGAARKMDRLENREAGRELGAIEKELMKYRLGDATRPILADVLLKLGIISMWDGNPESAAGLLRKARSLRPDFVPDPGLYSPQFRQMWTDIGSGLPPEAELFVESIPPGATVLVDDSVRGMTPLRMKVVAARPVRLRLEHPGFQPYTSNRQWLPGDSERIELILAGDREARLAGFLASTAPEIREAGPIVSEMAKESGAARVAFLMFDKRDGSGELRVLAASASSPSPRLLGSIPFQEGPEGVSSIAAKTTAMLAESGWPLRSAEVVSTRRPWYYSWWFLSAMGLLVAGTAVALSGGGGGGNGGSTSSSSGVNF